MITWRATLVGNPFDGVSEPVPFGAFEYCRNGVGTGRPAAQFFRGSSSGRPGSRSAPTAGPDIGHEAVVGA